VIDGEAYQSGLEHRFSVIVLGAQNHDGCLFLFFLQYSKGVLYVPVAAW
jgi:hypothetical protein